MTQTRTTADAVLKEFYLPPLRNILNDKVFLLSQIERSSERVEGSEVVLALKLGRNQGVGARSENAALPTPGQQRYGNVRVQVKYNYGSFELTGPTMRSMASSRGSFVRPVQSEMEGLVTDIKDDVERQIAGDGTGVLFIASGAGNAAGNIPTAALSQDMLRFLQVGMSLTIYAGNTDTVRVAQTTIESVTSTLVDTTASTATVVTGDVVRRENVLSTNEITGLRKIVDSTGLLYALDPATEPAWSSYEAVGGALSEDMFIIANQEVSLRTGEDVDLWLTDAIIHRGIAKLLQGIRRFNDPLTIKAGYKALDMSYVGQADSSGRTQGMVYTKYAKPGEAIGITTARLQFDRMSDWEFMNEDGAVLQRSIGAAGRRDAYEATLFCYADVCTDNRAAHAKITGIT